MIGIDESWTAGAGLRRRPVPGSGNMTIHLEESGRPCPPEFTPHRQNPCARIAMRGLPFWWKLLNFASRNCSR